MPETRTRLLRRVAAALAAVLVVAAGCAPAQDDEGQGAATVTGGDTSNRTRLDQPWPVPQTPLQDTGGSAYSLAGDTDRPLTLVFFGYLNCPDVCHTVMSAIASAMTRLDEGHRDQVDVVFVTTDPARDDAQALRDYLDRLDPEFTGLTGDIDTILDVAGDLHIGVEQGKKLPSGGYDITHGTQVLGIDADDEVPVFWSEETSAAELADDVSGFLEREG